MEQNINDAKSQMINDLQHTLSMVNDIDIKKDVNSFFKKGGYNPNKSFDINKKSCIQFIALKKAYKK